MDTVLYILIPCYNEEAVLHESSRQMLQLMKNMKSEKLVSSKSRIVFIDDGSKDKTWEIINRLCNDYEDIQGIKLACNCGHQNALFAGLTAVMDECDCTITIDADLQDDIHCIPKMVEHFQNGCDIVYGVRSDRSSDSVFKRSSAVAFYKLMKTMGVNIVFNHADYRLMSKRAAKTLSQFEERNMFLRGMVPLVGFKSEKVYYERTERFAGNTKYPLKKMISFAFDGITSFTIRPIRLITSFGALVCIFSFIMAIYSFIVKITGHTTVGWASLMISIWFLGGVQLMSLGLVGEYIGKIYKEVKRRPRFIIEEHKK